MKEDKKFYIVDKSVLPEIFLKVMDVKNLLASGREKTVQDAVSNVGKAEVRFINIVMLFFRFMKTQEEKRLLSVLILTIQKGDSFRST